MNAKTFRHILGVGVVSLIFVSLLIATSPSLRLDSWEGGFAFGLILGLMFFAFINYIMTKTGRGW